MNPEKMAEILAHDWFTLNPKYRTKKRLAKYFEEALVKYSRGIQPPGASLEAHRHDRVSAGDSGRCCTCCHVETEARTASVESGRSDTLQSSASLLNLSGRQ